MAPATSTPASTQTSNASSDDRTMSLLAHLLGIVTGFIGALVIWLIKKDQSSFVANNSREALNFQLTLMIGWIAAFVLSFLLIGFLLYPILWVANLIFCILGAMAANKGEEYRYPVSIRFIK